MSTQHEPNADLLRPSEVARILGVTTATIHAWRQRGHVLAVELPNGQYRVPLSEVERLAGKDGAQ